MALRGVTGRVEFPPQNVNDQQPRTKEAAIMSDTNERSVASAGSQPVAWAVTAGPPGDLSVYEAFADHQKDEAMSLARECLFGETNRPLPLAPLYFAPTLTDEEREALRRMLPTLMYEPHRVAVESILQRLG
jgi:hypothetical protein